ncbi:MAG: class I SAM-dependent methyltransferase [Clostridia bacterium]|nr:class I SAM-dependent methyltransferase [Clostridia bacterium]
MSLTALKLYAEQHNVPITKDDTMQFIIDYINRNKVKTILEIGTAIAYASINMAMCDSVKSVTTLEIDTDNYREALNNIAKFNMLNKIDARLIDAKWYIEECDKKFDLIYLDGPKGQYINYLPRLLELLNPNGTIIADNIFFHGMVTGEIPTPSSCRSMVNGLRQYVDEVTHNEKLESHIYQLGDGIAVTRLKQ